MKLLIIASLLAVAFGNNLMCYDTDTKGSKDCGTEAKKCFGPKWIDFTGKLNFI